MLAAVPNSAPRGPARDPIVDAARDVVLSPTTLAAGHVEAPLPPMRRNPLPYVVDKTLRH